MEGRRNILGDSPTVKPFRTGPTGKHGATAKRPGNVETFWKSPTGETFQKRFYVATFRRRPVAKRFDVACFGATWKRFAKSPGKYPDVETFVTTAKRSP